jgi:hypothetical protein
MEGGRPDAWERRAFLACVDQTQVADGVVLGESGVLLTRMHPERALCAHRVVTLGAGLGEVVGSAEPLQRPVFALRSVDVVGVAGRHGRCLVQWCDGGAAVAIGVDVLASAVCRAVAAGSSRVPVGG